MAYTETNPVAIGQATKKSVYDTLWNNAAAIWAGLVGKVTITQPATGSTLTIAEGKVLTCTQDTSLDEAVAMSSKANKSEVYSGTYTPTMTGVTNVEVITTAAAQYLRVGNTVTVSGTYNLNPTAAAAATEFGISLPVASNFTNALQCGGSTATAGYVEAMAIVSDAANDRATVQGICGNTSGAHTGSYSFTYQIL